MSRRDTIIIAVLLNAGLLIVLFATSLKSEKNPSELSVTAAAPKIEEVATSQPVAIAPTPEPIATTSDVDQMVKQYTSPAVAEGKPNFAEDLSAIGGQGTSPLVPTNISPTSEPLTSPKAISSEPSFKEVRVKKGDVLERIARRNNVTVDELMRANNLSSTRLKIGQLLKIPVGKGSVPQAESLSTTDDFSAKYYTVRAGDNPWTIAVKNHIKVEDLLKLNNLNEEKARRLKPGDKIRIK